MASRKFSFRKSKKTPSAPKSLGQNFAFEKNTLLPLDKIIELAKNAGVDFGKGNTKERLRYLTKLGILPNATRIVSPDLKSNKPASVGHLPYSCIEKLTLCQRLYKKGLAYQQIAKKIKAIEKRRLKDKVYPLQSPLQYNQKGSPIVDNDSKLLPTEKIISLAQNAGVDFGKGSIKERIRYLTKLGILPNAQRRVDRVQNAANGSLTGHLPEWTIKRLLYIDKLYQNGMSYPQIANRIKSETMEDKLNEILVQTQTSPHQSPLNQPAKAIAFIASFALIVTLTVIVGLKLPHNPQVLGARTTQDLLTFCKNLVFR